MGQPAQPIELKAYFRDLVSACGGTKRAAEIVGGQASHISEAMAAHNVDRWPRLDHVAILERECGFPLVTKALADALGFDLVARDAAAPHQKPLQHLRAIMKESAAVQQELADAMEDGTLTPRERRSLLTQVSEAQETLEALRRDLAEEERTHG